MQTSIDPLRQIHLSPSRSMYTNTCIYKNTCVHIHTEIHVYTCVSMKILCTDIKNDILFSDWSAALEILATCLHTLAYAYSNICARLWIYASCLHTHTYAYESKRVFSYTYVYENTLVHENACVYVSLHYVCTRMHVHTYQIHMCVYEYIHACGWWRRQLCRVSRTNWGAREKRQNQVARKVWVWVSLMLDSPHHLQFTMITNE